MNLTKRLACLVAIAGAANGAVTNVQVPGTTNTQAVLSYTAPDSAACTVEVSESAGYSPVVHDVNGTHFSGDNLDSRTGAVSRGRERTVVIGKRTVERAASGVAYSRALQAATTHYYRISCGADQAAGTFQTASIPFGDTHGDPVIPDPLTAGLAMQITPQFSRNSTWIDPQTGALIKRVSQPQDNNIFITYNDNLFTSVLESTNWTAADNVLLADSSSATYPGSSCGETCDWLKLTRNLPADPGYEERLDALRISVNGSGDHATAANRTVEVCPVTLGGTTIDPEGVCKDLVLPQNTPAKVTSSVSGLVDTWRAPGRHEITLVQAYVAGHYRFALRKKNSTGNISIDAVRIDWWHSTTHNVGTGGSLERCSSITRTDDDGERYLCSGFTATAAMNLYSIHAETGNVRFLGAIYRGSSFGVVQDHHIWDSTNPNRFYGQGSGDSDQYTLTYSGNGGDKPAGYKAEFTTTPLHTAGADEKLGPGVKTFVAAHSPEYGGLTFDDTKFACPVDSAQGDYLLLSCRRGAQDTIAWLAVYQLSMQTIIAAQPQFAAPTTRWCVLHTRDPLGPVPVSMVSPTFAKDSYIGNGIYKSTLAGDITSSTTSVTVTSTCSGDPSCSDHVPGEPVSPFADKYLQPAQVGDVFAIGSEYVRITAKTSPTSWTIARGVVGPGAGPAVSHNDGATFNATCAMKPGSGPTNYIATYLTVWDFIGDPYGMDSTGTYTWGNLYTGHMMSRRNMLVGNKSVAITAEGTPIVSSVKDPTYAHNVPEAPWFAGKFAPGPGNAFQQHPAIHHVAAPASERQFFWDIRPFVGGNGFTPTTAGCNPALPVWPGVNGCAAARVPGLSNVYRMAVTDGTSNPDGLNPKHFALYGVAKTNVLRDVSGPGSVLDDSAAKNYTFCYALAANECVTGSAAGNSYVQVPNLTVFHCTGGEGYAGGNDVCLSDYMSTGNSLAQFGFAHSKEGIDPAQLSNPNATGAAWTRKIATHGLNLSYRLISNFTTGKPLANGKWVLATDWLETPLGRGLLVLVKVPPVVKDTVNRSTFVPAAVKIESAPRGTDNVVVEFGYAEHGSPDQFRCTSRAEACVAVGATVNEAVPFFYAGTESYSGMSCANGCKVTLPLYPARVAYYRVKFRDAANNVLLAGPLEVAVAR